MKELVVIFLAVAMAANLTGCTTLQRKFTRKSKTAAKKPRIYQVKKYVKVPSPELYKKHYSYWQSWQAELLKVLGQNQKKDVRCIDEIIGNLTDMENLLVPEKGALLRKHIDKLNVVRDIIIRGSLSQPNRVYVQSTLEREERAIHREFAYDKVKDYLKKSFDEDESDEGQISS